MECSWIAAADSGLTLPAHLRYLYSTISAMRACPSAHETRTLSPPRQCTIRQHGRKSAEAVWLKTPALVAVGGYWLALFIGTHIPQLRPKCWFRKRLRQVAALDRLCGSGVSHLPATGRCAGRWAGGNCAAMLGAAGRLRRARRSDADPVRPHLRSRGLDRRHGRHAGRDGGRSAGRGVRRCQRRTAPMAAARAHDRPARFR